MMMNRRIRRSQRQARPPGGLREVELMVLPDGRVLAHALTVAVAGMLRALNPGDPEMAARGRGRSGRTAATRDQD